MYQYLWDEETGGLLLTTKQSKFSKEPRPVYASELTILGFDQYWLYPKDDSVPLMWAEANSYIYRGRLVAKTKGGALYTAPELIILEDPEPNGAPLRFVDIDRMVEKNSNLMKTLEQESIQFIYNTYAKYKGKVDIFHVSYSGGKDSEVTLDLVQKALPHDDFVVVFGDTGMEFPDTYNAVEKTKLDCERKKIKFIIAKADSDPIKNWYTFGPPSSAMRWCCSVHKTTPQLTSLRQFTGKSNLREMAFVGVRGEESIRRSTYEQVSLGAKHKGQYSCNPILYWSSAEVYLYIFLNRLYLNNAYQKGSGRVGCLFCPMATEKSDFINFTLYPEKVKPFVKAIKDLYIYKNEEDGTTFSYLNNKGWKARKNGRDLIIGVGDYVETIKNDKLLIAIKSNEQWKEWLKTVGNLDSHDGIYFLSVTSEIIYNFTVTNRHDGYMEFAFKNIDAKNNPTEFKYIKNCLKKSQSCIGCRHCEANCPYGNISFDENNQVHISEYCIKCKCCNKLDNGCLVYNSLILPKGGGTTMRSGSIDEYGTHPLKLEWLQQFIKLGNDFDFNHKLGSAMVPMFKKYLRNSGLLTEKNKYTRLTDHLFRKGLHEESVWALMLVNLSYSSCIGWLVDNLKFGESYSKLEIKEILTNFITTKTGPGNIANCYGKFAELPFSSVGLGGLIEKTKNDFVFMRTPWAEPDARVILYSLYKFAEKCGGYYQFSLSALLDDSIERDGISPTRIFGLNYDTMLPILNGLSVNYSDFISASFSLGLDTISLCEDKSSQDVLTIF